jgi:hypothetical protein
VVSTVALTLPVDFVKVLELMPGDNELLLRAGFGWKAAGSDLQPERRAARARCQRHQAWQPVAAAGPTRIDLVRRTHAARHDFDL